MPLVSPIFADLQNFAGPLDEAVEAVDRAGRFLTEHLTT